MNATKPGFAGTPPAVPAVAAAAPQPEPPSSTVLLSLVTPWGTLTITLTSEWVPVTPPV